MEKLLRIFNALDWLVGGLSILVGLYMSNIWVILSGVIALIAAYYKPAQRIKDVLEKKFIRKRAKTEDSAATVAEEEFYAQMLGNAPQENVVAAAAPAQARTFADPAVPYGAVFLSPNKHNRLKPQHIGLSSTVDPNRYY